MYQTKLITDKIILIILTITLLSCSKKPVIQIDLNEQVKPMSAFSINLKLYNPYKSKLRINSFKNEITLYFFTYNQTEKKWARVCIGIGEYLIDSAHEHVYRKTLNPSDTLKYTIELTPLQIMDEDQEYILRMIYYTGRKKALYSQPFEISNNVFKSINDCIISDIDIKVSQLNDIEKEAMKWLKNVNPKYNLSIANDPTKEMEKGLLNFINTYNNSTYTNRAKLVYTKNVLYPANYANIDTSIKFLEELLIEKKMSHLHDWIRVSLEALKQIKMSK